MHVGAKFKSKVIIFLIFLISAFVPFKAFTQNTTSQPKLFAYWAGWSNDRKGATIPNFNFDGLFLSFAIFKNKTPTTHYYTDYGLSGDFNKPTNYGSYSTWKKWSDKYKASGRAKGYVSYGGASNEGFRSWIMKATDDELMAMAGEIKGNVALFNFDGVDLDIEDWWLYKKEENELFADRLAFLVIKLRESMDEWGDTTKTKGKPIMVAVAKYAAGGGGDNSTMLRYFQNTKAMKATAYVNIMAYNDNNDGFYRDFDNQVRPLLNKFTSAGVPKEKIILGFQPYETTGSKTRTEPQDAYKLAQRIKAEGYGGMFFFGLLSERITVDDEYQYLNKLREGLGLLP